MKLITNMGCHTYSVMRGYDIITFDCYDSHTSIWNKNIGWLGCRRYIISNDNRLEDI